MLSSDSSINLALLTLNLSKNDFNKMNRNDLKQYINNFIQEYNNDVNLDKYKLASQVLLDNKQNNYNERYNINNQLGFRDFDPFFGFNNHFNHFNSMMNEFNNFHNQFNSNFPISEEQSNSTKFDRSTQSQEFNNSSMKTYNRTYVNNNGNGYIKEESMERGVDGVPKYNSVYKKIEDGKLLDGKLLDIKKRK
jgi:hypothetical protein